MATLGPEAFERVQRIIDRIAPEWKSQPNVLGIAPVLKVAKGRVQTDVLAIGFHVSEKVRPDVLADRGYRSIPAEIEGVPTDVILAAHRARGSVDTKSTRSQMFDTLVGGIAVGNANMNVYGTLAIPLLAVSDGRMVGLTNEHVLVFDVDGKVGDEVQQPRFYLNSEVSLDSAACCPNGQLHYRGVDNPIVDASVAVFAAAALAAVLSDEIDPHRRGQDATVPDPGERTLRETVSVEMNYPEIPLPGKPYKLDVNWKYRRETDRRSLGHSVSETKQNGHFIAVQRLLTDKHVYAPGETVLFTGLLGLEPKQKACGNMFVTAAALSPDHQRAYKIILRPAEAAVPARSRGEVANRRCFSFVHQRRGDKFNTPRVIDGVTYDPGGSTAVFLPVPGSGSIALRFPDRGLTVRFPSPVQGVFARVLVFGGQVKMTAWSGATDVGSAVITALKPDVSIVASNITHVTFVGGSNEAFLVEICVQTAEGPFCVYRGQLQLAPNEQIGPWKTYLFAQTRNDVAVDADPLVAAQTIGGLPVTHNFIYTGGSEHIVYGHRCNIEQVPDGDFDVSSAIFPVIG